MMNSRRCMTGGHIHKNHRQQEGLIWDRLYKREAFHKETLDAQTLQEEASPLVDLKDGGIK